MKNKKILMILVIMLLSFLYARFICNYYDKAFLQYEKEYVVKINSLKAQVKNYNKYTAQIKSGKYKNYKIIIYTNKELEYGSIIKFKEKIELPDGPRNDKGFNYSRYLREKKISGIVKVKEIQIIRQEKNYKYYLLKFKSKLFNIVDEKFEKEEAGFLKAILLGDTSNLDEKIEENLKKANIAHILAISGMHVTYIVLAIEAFFKKVIKNIKIRNGIIILFLYIFAIFIGESNSVWRACIMTSFVYLGKILLKKDDFFASFQVALIVLILANPYNIFSGSMWLSFGGSIGIVLYSKLIEKWSLKNLNKKLKNSFYNKIIQKIIQIASVSISAQVIVFPIMVYIFNTFSFNFIISNLLISELVGPILVLGYLSLALPIVSYLEKVLIKIIFLIAKFLADLPLNNLLIPTPSLFRIIAYYAILAVLAYTYQNRKIYLIRKIRKDKLKSILIVCIILLLVFGNFQIPYRKKFEIHFLDVGQGDSCLIRTTNNKTILIDGGKGIKDEYDYGKNVIVPYLLDHGIVRLDYIFVSHFDSDHCGGLFYILENFKVKNIIIGKQFDEYDNLVQFLRLQKGKNIKLISVDSRSHLNLDKDTRIDVLFPNIQNKILENEINNNSFVFKMYYKNFSILFTGDIEEEAEKVLVNLYGNRLRSTILKVPHHGSKTSSTEDFIRNVNPKIALIGVGKNNNFGHPNEFVIERLEKLGTKVYRTDEMGEILIQISRSEKIRVKLLI